MTESTSAPRRALPTVLGAVLAVLLVAGLVVWLGARDDDTAPSSSPEGASTSGPASAEPTTADVPEAEAIDPAAAAAEAAAAGVPALVPDAYADQVGIVTAASYDDQVGVWLLEVTTETGTVVVRQHVRAAAALLAEHAPGAAEHGPVDLERWGLGTWTSFTTDGGAGLSRDLPGGGVLVSGPDLATVTAVTQTLLTHEDNRGGEQD